MKRYFMKITVVCILIFFSIPLASEIGFHSYKNYKFNYQIIIPNSWKLTELNLEYKHIMYAEKNEHTLIKVIAIKSSTKKIEEIIHENIWNMRKIDSKFNKIIETDKINIRNDITGKVFVFEYRFNNRNLLQRTMLIMNNQTFYTIECRSLYNTFYKFEDILTIAMSSFNFINDSKDQEETDEVSYNIKKTKYNKKVEEVI